MSKFTKTTGKLLKRAQATMIRRHLTRKGMKTSGVGMDEILKRIWESGKAHEVSFWSNWIVTKGDQWKEDFKNRLDPQLHFQEYLVPFLPQRSSVKVLDVGAGPLTALGKVVPGKQLEITAVDPLADEYNQMLEDFGIRPVITTQPCDAESLSDVFEENTFDFIHVMNALDHSYNPIKGIQEMLIVLKKNCHIFLTHYENEAEKECYSGFHQWNFCRNNDSFIMWNKNSEFDVNFEFQGKAKLDVQQYGNMINVDIIKL